MLQRHVGVTWRKLYQALSPALLIAIAAAAPALAIVMTFGLNGLYALATSIFTGVGAAAGWLAAVILLRHPIRDELQAIEHLLKRKRKIAG
jgi:Na+-transporting NADH:ubiquinone oxidoreductase subunit NqrE